MVKLKHNNVTSSLDFVQVEFLKNPTFLTLNIKLDNPIWIQEKSKDSNK